MPKRKQKKLTYHMLTEHERGALKKDWKRISRIEDIRFRSDELLDRAGQNFESANEAASKGEVHKYFVRGGFGAGAALLGWAGKLLAKLADRGDQPSVAQRLLKQYGCSEVDFSSFPKDFFD